MPRDSFTHHLNHMFQDWFLEYASYVILERAVPHISDGFKPVQRRILHSMKRMDDGRYNKVANIVGHTMQFHPHGDASIKDALVQLGQKELLIDCQGNWGNILTGDDAAAARYIEARLSKFALDVVFNPKTTEWKLSYDGRNKEPITLPVKFPLLLAQGAEGIAVGLSSKILPHNLVELCDAAISYLHNEPFQLYPDFPTGGSIDVSKYNDGARGGVVRVRAKIEKRDQKTLAITELPFGKTTGSPQKPSQFIDTILKAAEKGKIKVRKVEDMTAAGVEILIHLQPGASSDKTIDALYACTDCEVSISPNCCVIDGRKPCFLTVSEVLRRSVDNTRELLRRELLIRRGELMEALHFASLERIFIEERIYKGKPFENAQSTDDLCNYIDERLTPFYPQFVREVTKDDILKLLEIRMQRIAKFNKDRADEAIARMKDEIASIDRDLANIVEVTAEWFRFIKEKYGEQHPRRTEIRNFDSIQAAKVVEANQKLYINREEGFIGTGLKKDEFVCNCSDIDDVIIFYKDGTYKIIRIGEKVFVGETERSKAEKRKCQIIHIDIFKRGDTRTIYNCIYRDGKAGAYYIKRFNVTSITLNREYDLTRGKPGSRVVYFTANPNGEAETVRVAFKPVPKLRRIAMDKDFSEVQIRGRASGGYLLTKLDVDRISLKSHGTSTLGGRQVWFDWDVHRLNYDEHGQYLGEFHADDLILVVLPNGEFYTTTFDINNHYEQDILRIEKFDPHKVWTAVLIEPEQGFTYVKRFALEPSPRHQLFLPVPEPGARHALEAARLLLLTDTPAPHLLAHYAEPDDFREPLEFNAEEFIAQKSFKARGKRLTTLNVANVEEIPAEDSPVEDDAVENSPEADGPEADSPEANSSMTDGPETDGLETDISMTDDSEADTTPVGSPTDPTPNLDPETGQFSLF